MVLFENVIEKIEWSISQGTGVRDTGRRMIVRRGFNRYCFCKYSVQKKNVFVCHSYP
jgi:hypothetical protein